MTSTASGLLLLLGTLGAPESPESSDVVASWKLDRWYKYVWIQDSEKIGETTFQVRRARSRRGGSGSAKTSSADYVLTTRRQLETGGKSQSSEGSLRFRPSGRPVAFREATAFTFAVQSAYKGQQEVSIQFERGRARLTYVNNGKDQNPSRHDVELKKPAFLFSSHCIEQWNLFTPLLKKEGVSKIEFLFPDFARVGVIELTPRKELEKIEIGKSTVDARRYDFVARPWSNWTGRVWLDGKGRLLRYESAGLRVTLTTAP